jgi:predicted ATPase
MNEILNIKAFGPIKQVEIIIKSITILIGDQGTGKSCTAKLYATFKWMEKSIVSERLSISYFELDGKFIELTKYHRINSFFRDETEIQFDSQYLTFTYKENKLTITKKQNISPVLSKVMYIPAERSILSISEGNKKLLRELPQSALTFCDRFDDAKLEYKKGYNLPFGNLNFQYDPINDVSTIIGNNHDSKLTQAATGIQAALPMCLVSEYLSNKIKNKQEVSLTNKERKELSQKVESIINNPDYSASVKEAMLKQISALNTYGCFINIAEEPELNLFPASQREVLYSLIKSNTTSEQNKLFITTHSPYTLAFVNLLLMAYTTHAKANDEDKSAIEKLIDKQYYINPEHISAYNLTLDHDGSINSSIIDTNTCMLSKNDLDSISNSVTAEFNQLYKIYVKTLQS